MLSAVAIGLFCWRRGFKHPRNISRDCITGITDLVTLHPILLQPRVVVSSSYTTRSLRFFFDDFSNLIRETSRETNASQHPCEGAIGFLTHPTKSQILTLPRRSSAVAAIMVPSTPATDEYHQQLLRSLDITQIPRPFRNPHWRPSQRRNKNVKQLLSDSSRKEASVQATQANSGASTPLAADTSATTDGTQTPAEGASRPPNIAQAAQSLSTLVLEKNARAMFPMGPSVTYTNIESAPSLHPSNQKHYCDLTGLPAPYTDPKTRLRYHNKEVFSVVRTLGPGVAESYLEARGAHVVLK